MMEFGERGGLLIESLMMGFCEKDNRIRGGLFDGV